MVAWDFVRYLPHYFLTKSYQRKIQFVTCFSKSVGKKKSKFWKISFFMSFFSNLHWFFIHWHIKFFALLYQFCCIFIIRLLLVGCLTFTFMVYPLQHQWYLIVMSNMVWVLNFFRVLCFQTFHLYLCYISQANLT